MKRNNGTHRRWNAPRPFAWLAATGFLLIGGLSASTTAVATTSCANFDDDAGMGGSDVDCALDCSPNEALLIGAVAGDKDAMVAGAVNCGGQGATCPSQNVMCLGASEGLTESAGSGKCRAETDEFWSSMVTVVCATVGGIGDNSLLEQVCAAVGDQFPPCRDSADGDDGDGRRGTPLDKILELCAEGSSVSLSASDLEGVFPPAFAEVPLTSLLALRYYPDGSISRLDFDTTAAGATCSTVFQPGLLDVA